MDPYVGQIQVVGFNFPPKGWASCDGQLLPISQNTALFSILGTTFGGNGVSTFALPDFRDRTPMGWGQGPGLSPHDLGEPGGSADVTLAASQMPAHTHALIGEGNPAASGIPTSNIRLATADVQTYGPAVNLTPLSPAAMGNTGGGQPHNNRQPYLGLFFIIALQGVFPPRA